MTKVLNKFGDHLPAQRGEIKETTQRPLSEEGSKVVLVSTLMNITQSDLDRLNKIIDRGLCSGKGPADGPVCIEQAIAIVFDDSCGDAPSCVHPVIRAHSIVLNDAGWSSKQARADGLRSYALAQLGSTEIDGVEFVKRLALRTIREILPIALRAAGLEQHAKACEGASGLTAYAHAYAARAAARAAAADDAYDAAARGVEAVTYNAVDGGAAAHAAGAAARAAAYAEDRADGESDNVLAMSACIASEIITDLRADQVAK